MPFTFGHRRGEYLDMSLQSEEAVPPLEAAEVQSRERFDLIYRSLCAMLYNYAPMSGHPGGSISCGRIVACLLSDTLDYDVANPAREDADVVCFAAGHKVLGMYALWALRNEVLRIGRPDLLPPDVGDQLRLEDLLGFRKNPITSTPLFKKHHVKPLDGHPTPATPFVRFATGASGVGIGSSIGFAIGALDHFGSDAPFIHIIEGEGGLTPGRSAEALAAAGSSSLGNVALHVDWNQASIDSDRVCREGETPGDYVQWNPMELASLHDWNVIWVPDGRDFSQIIAAQRRLRTLHTGQPTAIVYRTQKGWGYGIEGRLSHGAGHALCAEGFRQSLAPLLDTAGDPLPRCAEGDKRCSGGADAVLLEDCFWQALSVIRAKLEQSAPLVSMLASRFSEARDRLNQRKRTPRPNVPNIHAVHETAVRGLRAGPKELALAWGTTTSLRAELGRTLRYLNSASSGALLSASADLLGSTSRNTVGQGFGEGFFNAAANPQSRSLALGGICEDGIVAILSGISAFGHAMGVGDRHHGVHPSHSLPLDWLPARPRDEPPPLQGRSLSRQRSRQNGLEGSRS